MIYQGNSYEPQDEEQPNFWASYSDLMAGMLMVFVLLLIVAMFHFAEFTRQKQQILELQEDKLVAFQKIQQKLIENLEEAFVEETVSVDSKTGVLQIGSGILFGEGEATLQPDGKEQLRKIFDAYISVVLGEDFEDFIKQIEIEGHTNSHGSYLHNLELSQQRAFTVMGELLAHSGDQRERLQQMVVASGRSYSHLIYDAQGNEDKVRSRRIELKFRLKESELFENIYRDLAE